MKNSASASGTLKAASSRAMLHSSSSAHFGVRAEPTVVLKVGTSSLIRPDRNALNLSSLAGIVEAVRDLRAAGYNVVIVSSGAVGVGCQRLGLEHRPSELAKKQALAAVGQVHLMRYYDDLFSAIGLKCAQVLLTLDNLANRGQYINARNTFDELLKYGVIPIVNENDTVAVEQLRIGDNDTLSAQVALLVRADWLFLFTDVSALYTSNPNTDPDAKPIHDVPDVSRLDVDTSTRGTQWGTGGMATKLTAARMATAAGCAMVICHFKDPGAALRIINGERSGTVFRAQSCPLKGRKVWILTVPPAGDIWLDEGAVAAVRDRRKSLFSAGILKVVGRFIAQDAVRLCDSSGVEFARALINYASEELDTIKGMTSQRVAAYLGFVGQDEVAHRTNICLLSGSDHHDDREDDGESHRQGRGMARSFTPPPGRWERSPSPAPFEPVPHAPEHFPEDADCRRPELGGAGGGSAASFPADDNLDGLEVGFLAPARGPEELLSGAPSWPAAAPAAAEALAAPRARRPARDVADRLEQLRLRGDAAGGVPAAAPRKASLEYDSPQWEGELAAAVDAERRYAAAATGKGDAAAAGLDIDERGWLPK